MALHQELWSTLLGMSRRAEIVYVNDGSTDGSATILQDLVTQAASEDIRTRVITLRRGYGQTAALAAGIDHAEGDIIVALDADGQNNPADIPRLLGKLEEGFDVVSGWRHTRKDGRLLRRFPSDLANWLIRKLTGVPLHDTGCTLKAFRASLLREVKLYGDMHRFLPVYLFENGARVAELKVDHRPRKNGVSKYGIERIVKVLADIFFVHFISKYYTRPMHLFGLAGVLFFLAATLSGVLMFVFKFGWLQFLGISYRASFTETPLPTLVATFFLGGVISMFAGILAEILIRIRFDSKNMQAYAIQEVDDSQKDRE